MTATNMCSNFGGKWDSPPFRVGFFFGNFGTITKIKFIVSNIY